jgi:hypothetical protein
MSLFKEKVNLGVNDLWAVAYKDYKPYTDRLRSTNTPEFTRDTTLDRVVDIFDKDNTLDKKSGS